MLTILAQKYDTKKRTFQDSHFRGGELTGISLFSLVSFSSPSGRPQADFRPARIALRNCPSSRPVRFYYRFFLCISGSSPGQNIICAKGSSRTFRWRFSAKQAGRPDFRPVFGIFRNVAITCQSGGGRIPQAAEGFCRVPSSLVSGTGNP